MVEAWHSAAQMSAINTSFSGGKCLLVGIGDGSDINLTPFPGRCIDCSGEHAALRLKDGLASISRHPCVMSGVCVPCDVETKIRKLYFVSKSDVTLSCNCGRGSNLRLATCNLLHWHFQTLSVISTRCRLAACFLISFRSAVGRLDFLFFL